MRRTTPSDGNLKSPSAWTLGGIGLFLICCLGLLLWRAPHVALLLALSLAGSIALPVFLILVALLLAAIRPPPKKLTLLVSLFLALLCAWGIGLLSAIYVEDVLISLVIASVGLLLAGIGYAWRQGPSLAKALDFVRSEQDKATAVVPESTNAVSQLLTTVGLLLRDAPRRAKLVVVGVVSIAFLVPVVMWMVHPEPHLVLEPGVVNFGRDKHSLPLRIRSSSEQQSIPWKLDIPNRETGWLDPSKDEGLADYVGEVIELSISRHALDCRERQVRVKVLAADGRKANVDVKFDVRPDAKIPPDNIKFGAQTDSQTLVISNDGGGDLCFRYAGIEPYRSETDASKLRECVTVLPAGGALTCSPGETSDLVIRIDRQNLPRRRLVYKAKLEYVISCCHGEQQEHQYRIIEVSHPPPIITPIGIDADTPLVVDPTSTQTEILAIDFTLKNTGDIPASWRFSRESPREWILGVSQDHGNLLVEEEVVVTLLVDPCELPTESQLQHISIELTDIGEVVELPCRVERVKEPEIHVDREILAIGSDEAADLWVSNVGCGTLDWRTEWIEVPPEDDVDPPYEEPDWIRQIEKPSGTVTRGNPDRVTISVDRGSLASGFREATLRFVQQGDETDWEDVRVSIDILPELHVEPVRLLFDGWLDEKEIAISNVGYNTLYWKIEVPEETWLSASKLEGTILRSAGEGRNDEEDTVTVRVDRSKLPGEADTAVLLISSTESGGDSEEVEVIARHQRAPTLGVSPFACVSTSGEPFNPGLGLTYSLHWPHFSAGVAGSAFWPHASQFAELYAFGSLTYGSSLMLGLGGGLGFSPLPEWREGLGNPLDRIMIVSLVELEKELQPHHERWKRFINLRASAGYLVVEKELQFRIGIGLRWKYCVP